MVAMFFLVGTPRAWWILVERTLVSVRVGLRLGSIPIAISIQPKAIQSSGLTLSAVTIPSGRFRLVRVIASSFNLTFASPHPPPLYFLPVVSCRFLVTNQSFTAVTYATTKNDGFRWVNEPSTRLLAPPATQFTPLTHRHRVKGLPDSVRGNQPLLRDVEGKVVGPVPADPFLIPPVADPRSSN